MTRIIPALLTVLLLAGRPVVAAEFEPSDYYTAAYTILGSAGGAVLGASLAGLSRPTSSSTVRPFMQWGAVGAVAGGALGRDLAQFSLSQKSDIPGPKPVSTREANACLGALGGQLAGYAIVAAVNNPISVNDRTVWAGIALGTLLGSAIGYILPPFRFFSLPPEQSKKARLFEARSTRVEPLIPASPEASRFVSAAEAVPRAGLPATRPFLPASKLVKLDSMITSPENDRILKSYRPVFPEVDPSKTPPSNGQVGESGIAPASPAVQLASLAGFCLGASAGASLGGSRDKMQARIGVGGAAGLLGGWMLARSALSPAKIMSVEETEQTGRLLSMTSAWTIAGTMMGIGSGAIFRNSFEKFRIVDAARVTLGFAWSGMVGGAISSYF